MSDFLNGVPYTNFHELNAEWLIRELKAAIARVDDLEENMLTMDNLIKILDKKFTPNVLAEALRQIGAGGSYCENELDIIPNVESTVARSGDIPGYYDELIRAYDKLVSPEGVELERTVWGKDQSETYDLIYYTWTANTYRKTETYGGHSQAENLRRVNDMSNTMILSSGIHGNERQAVWSLYDAVKWLMTSKDPAAVWMRNNYNYIILPCVNPYGFCENDRLNANGVDINRNFAYHWEESQAADKGSEAKSEAETKFVTDILESIPANQRHATAFFDFHNYTNVDERHPYYFYAGANYPECKNLLLALLIWLDTYKTNQHIWEEFELKEPNIDFVYMAASPTAGRTAYHMGFSYSIIFEARLMLTLDRKYTSDSAKMNTMETALAMLMYSKYLIAEKQPQIIRSLEQLDIDDTSTLTELSDKLPGNTNISLYVPAAWADSTLGKEMPTSSYDESTDTWSLIPGLLEVVKAAGTNTNITVYRYTTTYGTLHAMYYCYRQYGGSISAWYRISAEPIS